MDPAPPAVGLCMSACSQAGANGVCQKNAVFLEQHLCMHEMESMGIIHLGGGGRQLQ